MSVTIKEVSTAEDIKEFVDFQFNLYENHPYWVPSIRQEEERSINPTYNPSFNYFNAKFWIAYKNGKAAGRIGAIINHIHNEKTGGNRARFTRIEFIDDNEVFDLLIDVVTKFATAHGMVEISGPLGFNNLDHQGLLIEGFDWMPCVASDYHHQYYKKHFDRLSFDKEIDWLEFRITFPEQLPERAIKICDLVKERYQLTPLNFKTKKEFAKYTDELFEVFNASFAHLFGTFELPDEVVKFYIQKYMTILNPKFVKCVLDKNGKLAGFLVAMPSLSKALQKANGKIFPFGWWHIRKALKNPTDMDLMLTGIMPEYIGMGFASVLMNELWKTANTFNIKHVETTAMLENNNIAFQTWKSFEHIQHKRKRCFRKSIS